MAYDCFKALFSSDTIIKEGVLTSAKFPDWEEHGRVAVSRPFSQLEVYDDIFDMIPYKASEPDDFQPPFYQTYAQLWATM